MAQPGKGRQERTQRGKAKARIERERGSVAKGNAGKENMGRGKEATGKRAATGKGAVTRERDKLEVIIRTRTTKVEY
jgi:hypothetical protein